jgi:hydroxymethylglutaryl-CoA synthase
LFYLVLCLYYFVLLHDSHDISELVGKRAVLFSYGSGLASSMFAMRVSHDQTPGSALSRLLSGVSDVRQRLDARLKVDPAEFAATLKLREDTHHCGETLNSLLVYGSFS